MALFTGAFFVAQVSLLSLFTPFFVPPVYLTTKIWGLSWARSWRTFTPFYGILRS